MGLFRYEAIDRSGKVLHGAMNARDEQQVQQRLAQMGYTARAIHSAASGRVPSSTAVSPPRQDSPQRTSGAMSSVTLASGVPVSVRPNVSLMSLARFFRHMATLVRSGMPINQALVEMNVVTHDRKLKYVLSRIQESTQAGRSLSTMMAEYPRVFPVHAIASVWAGELAGKLEIALEDVATDLEQEAADTRYGRIGWFLTKISLIGLVFVLPMASLDALLLPVLNQVLDAAGQVSRTQVLGMLWQNYASNLLWKSVVASVALVVFWIAWGFMKKSPVVRRLLDGALLYVPVWGRLHRDRALARFFRVMDHLHSAGLSPAQAWDAASLVPKNSAIAERLRLARASMPMTAKVSEILAASGVASPEDVGLAASGEKAGQLPDVLSHLSRHYEERAASQKTAAKAAAIFALTMFSIIFTGYVMIRAVASYAELPFKIMETVAK